MRQSTGLQHDDIFQGVAPAPRATLRAVHIAPLAEVEPSIREKYRRDWRVVKRARFNAAMRFEKKQDASTMAFALAGLFGFLVPIYTLIFSEAITHFAKNVLDFTSYVIGALALVVGLIEQSRDYLSRARRFQECGREVNKVLRKSTFTERLTDDDFRQLIDQYEKALDDCGDNHNETDYEIAQAQEDMKNSDPARRKESRSALRWLKAKQFLNVYGLYTVIMLAPIAIALVIWLNR